MTSSRPKVSVLMLTYNHEAYIEQAVRSVLQQETDFSVEILIGEDCSTDGTRLILQQLANEHPDKLSLVLRKVNLGMHANFGDLWNRCRGEYIALLEGDDYWIDDQKLQKQVSAMDEHPQWAMVFHRAHYVPEGGERPSYIHPPIHWEESITLETLIKHNFIPTQSVMYRQGLVCSLPEWRERVPMVDWVLHILHARLGTIGFLPEVMSVYRIHTSGIWTSKGPFEQGCACYELWNLLEEELGSQYIPLIRQGRKRHLEMLYAQLLQVNEERDRIAKERDQILNSTSFRIGRAFTRLKFW